MQIELPPETVKLVNSLTTDDKDVVVIINEALERMAWERQEVAAVMEGVEDYKAGRYRPLEEFGKEIQEEFGIKLPE